MKTNLLVALSTATLLFSCNDSISEPPSPPEEPSRASITTILPDTSSTVTLAKAMQIALTQLAPQCSRAAEKEIQSVESLTDSLGIAQMYIVNFANNRGFVIVSASKDYLPVIAESDHGNFDINNISPDHPVNLWIAEQKFKISHADSFDPEVKASIASLWTSLDTDKKELISDSRSGAPGKPQVYYDSLARWSMDPNLTVYLYEDYMRTSEYANLSPMIKSEIQSQLLQWGNGNYGSIESSTIVLRREIYEYFENQLLKTKWGQRAPFNNLQPDKYPLGCTTIAAGQIINYHKFPTSFNWRQIHNTGYASAT
ncbi:MAG: C10 family peptidase, partial [Paramuribaculum sp.]|nr:C10 family peptidase [Paramuribaculum sp.]